MDTSVVRFPVGSFISCEECGVDLGFVQRILQNKLYVCDLSRKESLHINPSLCAPIPLERIRGGLTNIIARHDETNSVGVIVSEQILINKLYVMLQLEDGRRTPFYAIENIVPCCMSSW